MYLQGVQEGLAGWERHILSVNFIWFCHPAITGQSLDVCLKTLEAAIVFQLRERSLWSSSRCLITCAVNAEVSLLSVEVGWLLRQGSGQLHCTHENQGSVAF